MRHLAVYAWNETIRRKKKAVGNILNYTIAVFFLLITLTFAGFSSLGTASVLQYTGAQFIGFIYSTSHEAEVSFVRPDREGFFVYHNPVEMFPLELIDEINRSPNVRHAAPMLTFTMLTSETVDYSLIVAGFDPSDMESVRMASCSDTDVVEGRLLGPEDTGFILLEQTFADAEEFQAGDVLLLGDREFVVAGILSPGTRPAKADVYMSLVDAVEVLNTRIEPRVGMVANIVLVDGSSAWLNSQAQRDVKEILGFNSSTIGYGCFNPAGTALGLTVKGMRMLGLMVFVTIFLVILFAQYFSIEERKNDIGILKAIGWTKTNIISRLVWESGIQATIGSVSGIVLAILLLLIFPVGQWLGMDGSFQLAPEPMLFLAGFFITIITGVLAGLLSALSTLRLNPAVILRGL
jgi:putative ABC transport system permease protein